jgi:hypothetical protein
MDYQALNTLIKTHPTWQTEDIYVLTDWVNEEVISADKDTLPSGEVFATILQNSSEFTALTDADKQMVRDILYVHSGEGIPTAPGTPARTALVNIFGGGSATITALAAAISYQISRAEDVGIIGVIRVSDVDYARSLG